MNPGPEELRGTRPVGVAPPARFEWAHRAQGGPAGEVDAWWWPRSRDLAAELGVLLPALMGDVVDVDRVAYSAGAWDPAPSSVGIRGRPVPLYRWLSLDADVVRVVDAAAGVIRVGVRRDGARPGRDDR